MGQVQGRGSQIEEKRENRKLADLREKGEKAPFSDSKIHLVSLYNDAAPNAWVFEDLVKGLRGINDKYSRVRFAIKMYSSPADFRRSAKEGLVKPNDVVVLVGMCVSRLEKFTAGCEDVDSLKSVLKYYIAIQDSKHTECKEFPEKTTLFLKIDSDKHHNKMAGYYNDVVFNDDHLGHKNALYRVAPPKDPVLLDTDFAWNVSQIREAFRQVNVDVDRARTKN